MTLQCWFGPAPPLPALPRPAQTRDTSGSTDDAATERTAVPAPSKPKEPSAQSPLDDRNIDSHSTASTVLFGQRITTNVKKFGNWLWSCLSPPTTVGFGTADSLARLGELEQQLALAALADVSSHAIGRNQHGLYDSCFSFSAHSGCRDLREGKHAARMGRGGGMRPSASEPDLLSRLDPRPGTLRNRSDSFDVMTGLSGVLPPPPPQQQQQQQQQQSRALPQTAPVLSASQLRAQQRQLEGLHTALRGLMAVYDCAAPQLMHLANEISDSAELWDTLLYR